MSCWLSDKHLYCWLKLSFMTARVMTILSCIHYLSSPWPVSYSQDVTCHYSEVTAMKSCDASCTQKSQIEFPWKPPLRQCYVQVHGWSSEIDLVEMAGLSLLHFREYFNKLEKVIRSIREVNTKLRRLVVGEDLIHAGKIYDALTSVVYNESPCIKGYIRT